MIRGRALFINKVMDGRIETNVCRVAFRGFYGGWIGSAVISFTALIRRCRLCAFYCKIQSASSFLYSYILAGSHTHIGPVVTKLRPALEILATGYKVISPELSQSRQISDFI